MLEIKGKYPKPLSHGGFQVMVAGKEHLSLAETICNEMEASALARGTGIARRSPLLIMDKIMEGKAVIALTSEGVWAGFCYLETWENGQFVSNSGLIVAPAFRNSGLARAIKRMVFRLARFKYPTAKIFGLTTGHAVMKINSDLGFEPVPYASLPKEDAFWDGCKSCVNHPILESKVRTNCFCTAMLFDPAEIQVPKKIIPLNLKDRFWAVRKGGLK